MNHHNILSVIQLDYALMKDIVKSGHKGRRLRLLHRITVAAGIRQLLDNPKILNIYGYCSLRTAEAAFLQRREQLILRFNVPLPNDFKNLCLTLTLHSRHP